MKNKLEAYEKLVEISRNNDYTTRNLVDCLTGQQYYKGIGIDLSRESYFQTILIFFFKFIVLKITE